MIPERLQQLDCTYNFMWIHCRSTGPFCEGGNAYCFCNATFSNGVHVLHGNLATFFLGDNVLKDAYKAFKQVYIQLIQTSIDTRIDLNCWLTLHYYEQVDLLTESMAELITDLKVKFIPKRPRCGPLTAEMLYRNAEKYFQMTDSWS